MNDTTTAKTELDLDALLAEAGIDSVLSMEKVTLIDDRTKAETLIMLKGEERNLAAQEKAVKARREVIRKLMKDSFESGSDLLTVIGMAGEAVPIAKMIYPEPSVRLNTEAIKERFPIADNPDLYIRSESTPQMRAV